ncbi:MAG TPA: hypothetical protein VKY57_07895 [Chitinispirillaceae bacterium]|nr:hypothetical protein [Chitinispirillaceae bacterium]
MKTRNVKKTDPLYEKKNQRGKNSIVNAVLINKVDLSLSIKIQNLINYFVECINELQNDKQNVITNLLICIEHIKKIAVKESGHFDRELENLFQEFLEGACFLGDIVKPLVNSEKSSNAHLSDLLLTAKTSHLQWLAVCILTELQITFSCT